MAKNKRGTGGGGGDGNSNGSDLAARVAALEQRAGLPHEVQNFIDRVNDSEAPTASARAAEHFGALSGDAVAAIQITNVIFELDTTKTTAHFVRVYQSGSSDDIASTAQPHGILPRQIVGSSITVVMDVQGDPNEVGVFSLQHTAAPSISLKVSDGPISVKYLFVTG